MEQVTAARGRVDIYFGKVRISFVLEFAEFASMAQESWSKPMVVNQSLCITEYLDKV